MADTDNRTAFDKLVAGISTEDRNAMLNRINQSSMRVVPIITPEEDSNANYGTLNEKIQENENKKYYIVFYRCLRLLFLRRYVFASGREYPSGGCHVFGV